MVVDMKEVVKQIQEATKHHVQKNLEIRSVKTGTQCFGTQTVMIDTNKGLFWAGYPNWSPCKLYVGMASRIS